MWLSKYSVPQNTLSCYKLIDKTWKNTHTKNQKNSPVKSAWESPHTTPSWWRVVWHSNKGSGKSCTNETFKIFVRSELTNKLI